MSKILKRTGADYLITDTGQTVPADSFLVIDPANYSLYSRSDDTIAAIANGDLTYNDGSSDLALANAVLHLQGSNPKLIDIESQPAFASKRVLIDGIWKDLFKRVHGVDSKLSDGVTFGAIVKNTTGYIEVVSPYPLAKFDSAEIIGAEKGDHLNFFVLDDANNTYSGLPVGTYGPNFMLNQFGFDVKMPTVPSYKDTSKYDANIYAGMIIMCAYTNNGAADKKIEMNVTLNEVK